MLINICSGKELIAIIIPGNYSAEGIQFFTPSEYSQQLAYMNRKCGYKIEPHVHNKLQRQVVNTQEVLLIRKGRLRVDLYDSEKKYIESRILESGDVILLAAGGHGFEMLDDTEIIEIKQGPYAGVDDKVRFASIENEKLKINDTGYE